MMTYEDLHRLCTQRRSVRGATAMGLGSCWVSLLHGKVTDLLHVPHDHNIIGGIMLGHLKKGEEPTDGHKGRKPLEKVCTWYE